MVALKTDRPPLLVFAEDWGRHISACQHIIRRLLDRYHILWVNTIGTRRPRFNRATLARGVEKVRDWFFRPRGAETRPANLTVVNPVMWPWFRSSFDRRINRTLLVRRLAPLIAALPRPPVVITKIPVVADLMDVFPDLRWIYYCVDDFTVWPGLDQGALRSLEEKLVARAHRLVAVSETLRDKLKAMGRSSDLLTHGVDCSFWSRPAEQEVRELHGLQRPLIMSWGLIDKRLDLSLVRHVAGRLEGGTVVFVGPTQDPDPGLFAIPRVRRLPAFPHNRLPSLAKQAEILVMPYADLPVTRAMQPLKLKEYLATGLPVVVRDLPANRSWADAMDLASSPEEFSAAVLERLKTGLPPEQSTARQRLALESWDAKANAFDEIILETQS
jgi:glycosyltransferase involved in cell wall biosynthesis